MQVEINSRGNGACPLCSSAGKCRIQDALYQSMDVFSDSDDRIEIVIDSCPQFQEKTKGE